METAKAKFLTRKFPPTLKWIDHVWDQAQCDYLHSIEFNFETTDDVNEFLKTLGIIAGIANPSFDDLDGLGEVNWPLPPHTTRDAVQRRAY